MGQPKFLPATRDVLARGRFEEYFSPRLSFGRFCWNLVLLGAVSIVPFLSVFVLSTPDFAEILINYPTAASRFFRQVFTNGLPVVFIINCIGFLLAEHVKQNKHLSTAVHLAIDITMRAVLFIFLHVLIYVLSADWFDSFGGEKWTALQVVGPTLSRSLLFENISGVYLYALLPGAIISHQAVVAAYQNNLQRRQPLLPVVSTVLATVGLVFLVTVFSSGLSRLL